MSERKYNCPNCGAPIDYTERCSYCGTIVNWMPTLTYEYVPAHIRERILSANLKVPYEILERVSIGQITTRLAEQMLHALPASLEVRKYDDPFENSAMFRGKLYINERV